MDIVHVVVIPKNNDNDILQNAYLLNILKHQVQSLITYITYIAFYICYL